MFNLDLFVISTFLPCFMSFYILLFVFFAAIEPQQQKRFVQSNPKLNVGVKQAEEHLMKVAGDPDVQSIVSSP